MPSARLKIKVVPGSSRDKIAGSLGDALRIRVMAPPEEGRANEAANEAAKEAAKEAVVQLLAERLGLPADAVTVASGHLSPLTL